MSSLLEKGLSISKNAVFSVFLNRAGKLLGRPFKVVLVLNEVANKLASKESGDNKFKQVFDVGRTLVRLVRNYVSGDYRQVETSTVVSALGVLLYTLSPVDLVPDFIPVVGFLDDLALISWFIEKFQGEILRFREWEKTHAAEETDDIPAASAKPTYAASNTNTENAPAIAEMGHS
ncbi:YkvA family protein [Hymenobacter canadensis]|uniref:YkvA family protein n=1 Tax=Hymenobacter canadensis TaxID=2999067 RepID=A0ABY7LSE1_9BACT|nr:YkvA family protein [Hymenobacter canadensis]WBA43337.1 YkvA family protein [Hymenobacter canadensis]